MVTVYQVNSAAGIDAGSPEWDDDSPDDALRPGWSKNTAVAVTAVVGLAIVGLALTAGGVVIRSLGSSDTIPVAAISPRLDSAEGEEVTMTQVEASPIVVHVVGEVMRPGVVELDAGSRVGDAIEEVGGLTENAALEALNLARVVTDGEQIIVPAIGDDISPPSGAGPSSQAGLVSLSLADHATLDSLPGIGPALASRIIAWRDTHGPFAEVSDVLAVSGIGPSTLERFAHLVVP